MSPDGIPLAYSSWSPFAIFDQVAAKAILAWLALPIVVCLLGYRLLKPKLRKTWFYRAALMVPIVSFVVAYLVIKPR